MQIIGIFCFIAIIAVAKTEFLAEPHLQTIDGHLYIYGANSKNISFEISPKGYLNLNGDSIDKIVKDAKRASASISSLKYTTLSKLEEDFKFTTFRVEQLAQRVNACEKAISNSQGGSSSVGIPLSYQLKINKLERRVKTILRNLAKRMCQKDPCLNGGTCHDKYLDYECRCLEGWEGKSCERDVNECAKFSGSDLGCQNGATCINKPGTYECVCAVGWYGLHCTRRSNDCSSGSSSELCGQGTCVTLTSGTKGHTCICDQGWKTDGTNPACVVDVDECVTHPCSKNPLVTCHNTPGHFFCGPCPTGYSGNGFTCQDVNECLTENGGCSVQPLVQCINTVGSYTCGPCPPGYMGDGKMCTFVGKCNVDNGGCHPNARCQEVGTNIQCQCLPGYSGSGIGPFGCESIPGPLKRDPCTPNPCRHGGRCHSSLGTNFTCSCKPGYTGRTCNRLLISPCSSNPCLNGGTCVSRQEYFFCRCTSLFTGRFCQVEKQNCGGYLNADDGELQFPSANSSSSRYDHNLNCAWIIIVNSTLVINVTFEYFDLESAPECQFDWVQIHDGKSAGDHIIGKFCGNALPNNGTIVSTTNYMYMWFKSDGSKSKMGFKLKWSAVRPVCGGSVNANIHGIIRSPGSPGKYPPNRDCMWLVTAPPGKRITFTFFEVYLEIHENCSYDYLEFHEGLSLNSPVLARYCNTTIPPPLITPGNTALVYFHSDQYQSDRGFQIAYHPTPGYPGCGGIFTNRRGEISPPMMEGRYIKNMDCAWLIKMPSNLKIKVEFTLFKLEDNCEADFVEIREGSSISDPLIGRYCGFSLPPPIMSEGNTLFVRFYSDFELELDGFRLVYSSVCSETFTSESGIVKSSGYLNSVITKDVCTYLIKQPPGKVIVLEFQDFDLNPGVSCYFQYLEVRDGHDEKSPLIKKYCGGEKIPRIVSTHNYLLLKMVSGDDEEHKGFLANYTTEDVSCGGIFTAPEGEISTPSESGLYPLNSRCRWIIVAKPEEVIQLTFNNFKLEQHPKCEFDYVEIYDNSSLIQGGGLMGRYCGEKIPRLFVSLGNVMTIIFRSDVGIEEEGFSAFYKTKNESNFCGGEYYTAMGVIKSPNYPKPYPNSRTCTWVIHVPHGNKIALNITDFQLEESDCSFDYLEIRDGGYDTSSLIGRYCGDKIPKTIVSQSSRLYLKFRSDFLTSTKGFFIMWDGSLTGCGGTLSSVTGKIISPNYPESYEANSLCIYKISVSRGSKILLSIMDLDLQNCPSEYVEILDGLDGSAKTLGKLCNEGDTPTSITSSDNKMMVKFVSSEGIHMEKGFYFKYRLDCNTNLTGHRGVIESPNFPEEYPPSMNCTWIIKAPIGNKINISFSDFNFKGSCNADYVEIREGNPLPTNTIGKFCKDTQPSLIASSLDWVHVKFVSDQYSSGGLFRMEWVVNGCGGTFIKPQGSFTSPNYPKTYPPDTLCEYYITVDPSLSINLYIRDINFEFLKNCFGDYLEIYGGRDASAPLLAKICEGKSEPIQIQVSGNEMYLKFATDLITGGTGFYANYTTVPARCGGHQISNYGRISSRNYPKNYNPMDNCLWVIQVEENHRVSLTFEDFDLESQPICNSTFVKVFDGPTEDFPVLLKHCGNSIPSPNPLRSTTNYLTVRMQTDQGLTAKGFKASYRMVCGAIITADEPGVISPSYYLQITHTYENCTWTIVSPEPDGHITLTVTTSDPSRLGYCSLNGVAVYDGLDNNATMLGTYCGQKSHLPLISRGNAITLELYRDQHSDGNLHFWAAYSSATSACGGNLFAPTGSFASPNYPESYPPNAECIWILSGSYGNLIQVNFKKFDLAITEHCNEEYVEIREKDAVGKLLGVYCGQDIPENLTSLNSIWVKFRSSKTGSGNQGFLADYSLVLQNEVNGTSGEIANPMYPRPFKSYLDTATWRITVDFGSFIQIIFKEVRLDDFYNVQCISSVTVHDGYDSTAPVLMKACGHDKPAPATSSSNVVFIVFSFFLVHHGSLFLLEWKKTESTYAWTDVVPSSSPLCSKHIDFNSMQNLSVTLTNPGWPEPYTEQTNLICEWVIESPDHQHLSLKINALSISQNPRCQEAHVSVLTRTSDTDWKEINRLCLSNETDRHITGTNFMKITFNSNYEDRSMFSMTVLRECGNSIKKPNGIIKFNWVNYTKFWTHEDSFCHWDITVSPGKMIKVVFTEFDFTTPDDTCREKYVMLRNGGSDDSPPLGKGVYCRFPGILPLTTSNRLYIKAKTDYEAMSITLRFEEVSPECGNRVKLDENFNVTIISSPNYPNIPPSKIECVWTFTTTGSHRLQIDFLDRFDLANTPNCKEEYVEIRDGGTEIAEELGRFCAQKPSTQKSNGNMLWVKYYTNATNPKNGFKAQISLARCGGIIRSTTGVLSSPGYPNSYQYDTECRWEIETDLNHRLKISFTDLDLPLVVQGIRRVSNFDIAALGFRRRNQNLRPRVWASDYTSKTNCSSSASIFLGEPAPPEPVLMLRYEPFIFRRRMWQSKRNVVLGHICDNDPVNPLRSSANKIIIVFQSGAAPRNSVGRSPRGFKLNFTADGKGCAYRMDTPSGVITSPGYPNEASNFYFCTWKIAVPKGRRVTLKVDDFDLPGSGMQQRVMFYNEHRYRSRIAVLTGSSTVQPVYKSSSNLMLVSFWSNYPTGMGHRGFKFTYDSDEPQICGGVLTGDQGSFSSPENLTSFYCKWEFQGRRPDNQTIAFYVKDAVIGNRTGICSLIYGAVLAFTSRSPSTYYQVELCGNVSSQIVRSPFPYTFVTAIESAWFSTVSFNVSYRVFSCGGTVMDPESTITSPSYPGHYSPGMDCAWLISFPPSQTIKLKFQDFSLQPSCSDFLTVKNGPSPKSPLIGQYCGTTIPVENTITSEGSSLFLEFHSDANSQGRGFKISVEPANQVCGGVIHSLGYELMTPNFPSEYGNNQECEWEINSIEGTHIGLVFVDRFHIESSENCQNDFVKVFDYVKDEWKLVKTLCGRELPSAINSTSNKMKVLFRSNGAVVSDGFKAKWYRNCGGTLWNVHAGTIVSPGYPGYWGNLDCTYIIDNNMEKTFLNFSQFNLEKPFKGICQYDSVTIYEAKWESNFDLVGKFCGSQPPSPRYLRGKIKIEFKTDTYNNYEGFVLNFSVTKCGGYVNESSRIGYYTEPHEIDMYSYLNSECIWNITAPKNRIVSLRIEKVVLPFSEHCDYSNLEISEERSNETVTIGRLCGLMGPRELVIKSTENNMIVKLMKTFQKDDGFSAFVAFTYGKAQGCGGEVTIHNNPETVQSPDVNGDGFYEEFLDCTWVIRAKPFHKIEANFRSIDVASCRNFSVGSSDSLENCSCDSVQLLDGELYHSEVLLLACGRTFPPAITSSGSVMTLKFTTDGTYNARGFNIRFSSKLSPCGVEILNPKDTIQTLTSPNYPENYPEGLTCKWTIYDPEDDPKRIIHVHVVVWDIEESKDCSNDYFSLEDTGLQHSVYQSNNYQYSRNKSEGTTEIIRGKTMSLHYYSKERAVGKMRFCGQGQSIDFYSATNEVTVGFSSNSGITKKGFKLDYSIAGCTRNYTGEHGHIKSMNFKNNSHCYITITAPSVNHTISLYFNYFTLGRDHSGSCTQSFMEVRDGPDVTSPLLGKFCGYSLVNPIFSSGQNLWLHFRMFSPSESDYQNVDITYTTTDKGKGCGGRFSEMIGSFTSPGYPQNVRKFSVCRWDIQVPPGMEILLQFSVFDIGPSSTCTFDFIEFYDVVSDTNTEVLRSRFCGRDTPAEIRSNADAVAVKYTTSVHNGGTGWQLNFKAVPPGFKII